MVSADSTPRQVQRLQELGAEAYLTKPMQLPTFWQTVERTLAGKA